MTTAWLVDQLTPQAPGFWLLVGALITALLLSVEQMASRRWRTLLWFAAWVLIPYLGLLLGGLSPRLMGLSDIDWPVSLSLGLGIFFGVVLVLLFVRATLTLGDPRSATDAGAQNLDLGAVLLWSGITQFHWSFLRGGLWETLLTMPDGPTLPGYWAVWLAAALVVGQLLWSKPTPQALLLQLAILATTSILFFYTRNFWLCWALHSAIQLAVAPSLVIVHLPGRAAHPARDGHAPVNTPRDAL